jgi:biopolymer transport protein ExbD
MRIRHADHQEKIQLQMVPMIDIVFQMLVFFIMTFRIVMQEGDFNIRMPSAAASRAVDPSELLPWTLVMKAGPDGELAELSLSGRSFGNSDNAFARLQRYIRDQLEASGGAMTDQEVEFDCDYDLNYKYVMRAITAVTGYVENGDRHKLIERIKFTPPESASR